MSMVYRNISIVLQTLGEAKKKEYGMNNVRIWDIHIKYLFNYAKAEEMNLWSSLMSFVCLMRCSWAGFFSETCQPWLMILLQTHFNRCTL